MGSVTSRENGARDLAIPAAQRQKALSRKTPFVVAGVILLGAWAAYFNTFHVPLLLDDSQAIANNVTLRHLASLRTVLSPPDYSGVSGRPFLNLTYAVNYAFGGTHVFGYHLVNFFLHAFAGMVLFGVVRRALRSPRLDGRFENAADVLAAAIALLWTVHPLLTESVTYISQRAESLMGLFYLLTLYGFVRSISDPGVGGKKGAAPRADSRSSRADPAVDKTVQRFNRWSVLSIAACALGMATKEVMVTAPPMVFVFDCVFYAGGFKAAWRGRRSYYCGLAATWLLTAWLMLVAGKHSIGFRQGVSLIDYASTECRAIPIYLGLAVWPHPLVFDYGPVLAAPSLAVLAGGLTILFLLGVTAFLLWRSPQVGFLGLWFFVILAPTSSLVPVALQPIAESRMYLPLAGIVTGAVLSGYAFWGARVRWPALALALAMIFATAVRNSDYRDALTIWRDTEAKRPRNPRAQDNLGGALASAGRLDEAILHIRRALQLTPKVAGIHYNLGNVLRDRGLRDQAIREYETALRLDPTFVNADVNLAATLAEAGRNEEAEKHLAHVGRLDLGDAGSHDTLGLALLQQGKVSESIREFEHALKLNTDDGQAWRGLGLAQMELGDLEGAKASFEAALKLDPADAESHFRMGNLLAMESRFTEAVNEWTQSLKLRPDDPEAHNNLAIALAQQGHIAEAMSHYEAALRLKPDYATARKNLEDLRLLKPDSTGSK